MSSFSCIFIHKYSAYLNYIHSLLCVFTHFAAVGRAFFINLPNGPGIKSPAGASAPAGLGYLSRLRQPTSPCSGVNRLFAISARSAAEAPVSTVRLYSMPGTTSNQMILPAPPSS